MNFEKLSWTPKGFKAVLFMVKFHFLHFVNSWSRFLITNMTDFVQWVVYSSCFQIGSELVQQRVVLFRVRQTWVLVVSFNISKQRSAKKKKRRRQNREERRTVNKHFTTRTHTMEKRSWIMIDIKADNSLVQILQRCCEMFWVELARVVQLIGYL